MINTKEIVAKVDRLPPIPKLVRQVLALVENPDFSFKDLMEIIRLDPAITAMVLKMCNSPYFGLVRKVSSLEEALTFMGANQIVEIVLGSQVVGHYGQGHDGYGLDKGDLWRHSMTAALFSQKLADLAGFKDRATLFTSALLHDVGKLVLNQFVADKYQEILDMVAREAVSFVEAERRLLGVDHAVLGALVARRWNFPENIVTAIGKHHQASEGGDQMTALVELADVFCISLGVGVGINGLAAPAPPDLLKRAGIDKRQRDLLMLEMKDILDGAQDMLNMAG